MDVICYCDGSGNGFVCAIFDYGEGYQRTYFGRIDDRIFHEYRAILFAVELMEPGHRYTLYNDGQGAVQHASGEKPPPTTIIKHLVQQIHKKVEVLDVEFKWVKRNQNLAGVMLDTKARDIYTDRGSSNNVSDWFEKAWQPLCEKCGGVIGSQGSCKSCGYVPKTGKVRL